MTSEWREVRLGDLVDLLTGYPFQSKSYVEDAFAPRLLRGDNVGPGSLRWEGVKRWPEQMAVDLNQYWLREGDVVLAMDRPWIEAGLKYASVRRSDLPSLLVQRVARLRGTTDLETSFLRYLIGSSAFTKHILGVQTGTTVPHISPSQIKSFLFRLPPVQVQRAIAHILGTLDDKIDLLCRMNQTLEETARMLFKSWFVRSLGANAKHLPIQTLLDAGMLQIGDGYRAKNSEMASEGIPFARAGNVNNGFRFDDEDLLGEDAIRSARDKLSQAWDVVFTSKVTVGRFAVVYPTTRRFVYSPQLCFWRSLDHERLNPMFLLCWMRSSAFIDQVATVSGQTDMALYVNLRDQRRMRIALPTPAAQREFGHTVRAIVERVEINENQMATLAETRDTLLPKLLSGALRIPDVERFLASEVRS